MGDTMSYAARRFLRVLRNGHPRIHTPYALRASQFPFAVIVALYVLISLVVSALLALGLAGSHTPEWPFLKAFRTAFSSTWGLSDLIEEDGQTAKFYTLAALAAISGVLLPIFFLGAFVFKLLRHDPIVWRQKISVEDSTDHGTGLVIRFYSGTHSPLADVRVRVFLRLQSSDTPPRSARNYPLIVVRGGVPSDEVMLPYASRGYPNLVRVPLRSSATSGMTLTASELVSGTRMEIQGKEASKANCEIIVLTSGVVAFTGDSFLSVKRYLASEDLLEGQPQWIDAETDPEADPYRWVGWENFENNAETYVFVYGSLVSRESLERSLPDGLGPSNGPFLASLRGYKRAWNVGSEASAQPERRWADSRGRHFNGVIASLGLLVDQHSNCIGAVYKVPVVVLGAFDVREREYDRVDVTGFVSWAGMDMAATVFTYFPKPEATRVLEEAIRADRAVASTNYLNVIQEAFGSFGQEHLDTYNRTTPDPTFRVEELTFSMVQPRSSQSPILNEAELAARERRGPSPAPPAPPDSTPGPTGS